LKVKGNDPQLLQLATVIAQWQARIGTGPGITVQQVINYGLNATDLHTALLAVAANRAGNLISNERLGRWLKKIEGRVVGGLTIRSGKAIGGYPTWCLVKD
jgi:hypothetical protein